jgi:hypothetical protein
MCADEEPTNPELRTYKFKGQLVYSCDNPIPLYNIQLFIGNQRFFTDSLGRFSGTLNTYSPYGNEVRMLGGSGTNKLKDLSGSINQSDTDLGTLYATNPPQVPLIVYYNLKNLDLSDFKTITLNFSYIGPNIDKIANSAEELLKPDTILINTNDFRFEPKNSSNSIGSFIYTNIGKNNSYLHRLNFSDLCGQKVTTIEFPG